MKIKIDNLETVLDNIDDLFALEELEGAMRKACLVIERSAKEKAPKDSGALKRSIASKIDYTSEGLVGVVYTPLEYAPYVEYGTGLFAEEGGRKDVPWHYQDDEGNWHSTSGQHPQPFMRPAFNENRNKVLRIIKEGFSK